MSAARVLIVLLALCLGACAQAPHQTVYTAGAHGGQAEGLEALGSELRSGQIILSEAAGVYNQFFSLFTERFSPYLHAGLLVFEADEPYVYEAFGEMKPNWTNGPPSDVMRGTVSRRPLKRYLEQHDFAAVYWPPPGADPARIVEIARLHYQRRTPFDPYMGMGLEDGFYCTEFVAHALQAAGGAPVEPTAIRDNPSLNVILDWLKIRASHVIMASSLVEPSRLVALLSSQGSRLDMQVSWAVGRELHARFTDDQRPGNLFRWTGSGLQLRDGPRELERRARALFRNGEALPEQAAIDAAVRDLALELFGPYAAAPDVRRNVSSDARSEQSRIAKAGAVDGETPELLAIASAPRRHQLPQTPALARSYFETPRTCSSPGLRCTADAQVARRQGNQETRPLRILRLAYPPEEL